MLGKFFSVLACYRLHHRGDRLQRGDNRSVDASRPLVWSFSKNRVSAFALNPADNCLLLSLPDDGVELPMTDFAAGFNPPGEAINWFSANDSPSTASTASIAFATLFLTTQISPERAPRMLV